MDINITRFVRSNDPFDYAASRWEMGDDAGKITWDNAVREGTDSPLLTTPEELDALRDYVREFGAWDDEEIAAWSDAECNALFIQLISGDMREAGLDDDFEDEFDWEEYERRANRGEISSRIFRGGGNEIYYYLGS